MKIKAIVFDLDGTIADTIPLTVYSIKEVVRKLTGRLLSDDEVTKEFGPIDTEIVKKLAGDKGDNSAVEHYIRHFTDNFGKFIKPIEGIVPLLQYIKENGIKTGLYLMILSNGCRR